MQGLFTKTLLETIVRGNGYNVKLSNNDFGGTQSLNLSDFFFNSSYIFLAQACAKLDWVLMTERRHAILAFLALKSCIEQDKRGNYQKTKNIPKKKKLKKNFNPFPKVLEGFALSPFLVLHTHRYT